MIPTLENFKKYLDNEIDAVENELLKGVKIFSMVDYSEFRGRYKSLLKVRKDLLGKEEDAIFWDIVISARN